MKLHKLLHHHTFRHRLADMATFGDAQEIVKAFYNFIQVDLALDECEASIKSATILVLYLGVI